MELTDINSIWFVHVEPNDPSELTPGDWFFHSGQWALCAEAGQHENGAWSVSIQFAKHDKPIPAMRKFSSLDEVKAFVSAYYEQPVIDVSPSDMPSPDDL